jgi:uncharacterized protein YcbK (DUF882 family)
MNGALPASPPVRVVLGKDGLLAGVLGKMNAGRGVAAQVAIAAAFAAGWLAPSSTESAIANGDTRTISLSNEHTNESGSFTFMVNGVYDQTVLDKLNWFLRDWRLNEPTKMDPHLFDIVWEVYRESGSTQPIDVLSAYRSPQTNAMLRRRSRQVAEHSQHMEGRAIDAHFVDVGTARIRDIAMRMQSGGVGFYPTGITPWVHIDSGSVRYWPRMSRDALTRLFPDGKTVFIPSDGQPMPGYEQARAEIEARGGQIQVAGGGFGIFSWLFGARGGGADDAEEEGGQEAIVTGNARGGRGGASQQPAPEVQVAQAGPEAVARAKRHLPTGPAYAEASPPPGNTQNLNANQDPIGRAKRDLPTGPAFASAVDSTPAPPAKSQVVAALSPRDAASDVSPAKSESSAKSDNLAAEAASSPMPPRRPNDLAVALALVDAPIPPVRPADLVLAAAAPTPPVNRPSTLVGASGLPSAIVNGVDRAPTGALALAEDPSVRAYDDGPLLARAAELTAPLPPMPIPAPIGSAPAVAPPDKAVASPAPQPSGGGVVQSAALAAEDLARLFGGLPFDAFKAASPAGDLRGPQP